MDNRFRLLFKKVCDGYTGTRLGKKATQKMFYFLERYGIDENLRYGIHYYGPYSSRLSDMIDELEDNGDISVDDHGSTHIIRWRGTEDINYLFSDEELIKIETVIQRYGSKSPLELEALSTLDYIGHTIFKDEGSKEEILNKFMNIKGEKFSKDSVERYYDELQRMIA